MNMYQSRGSRGKGGLFAGKAAIRAKFPCDSPVVERATCPTSIGR